VTLPTEFLVYIAQLLERLGIPYHVGGSVASSAHGMYRASADMADTWSCSRAPKTPSCGSWIGSDRGRSVGTPVAGCDLDSRGRGRLDEKHRSLDASRVLPTCSTPPSDRSRTRQARKVSSYRGCRAT
jgi:hypothetical protein